MKDIAQRGELDLHILSQGDFTFAARFSGSAPPPPRNIITKKSDRSLLISCYGAHNQHNHIGVTHLSMPTEGKLVN